MTYAMLAEQARGLSQESILDVARYIEFLKSKQAAKHTESQHANRFDCLVGGLKYIADDFDAPLDDFKEYM